MPTAHARNVARTRKKLLNDLAARVERAMQARPEVEACDPVPVQRWVPSVERTRFGVTMAQVGPARHYYAEPKGGLYPYPKPRGHIQRHRRTMTLCGRLAFGAGYKAVRRAPPCGACTQRQALIVAAEDAQEAKLQKEAARKPGVTAQERRDAMLAKPRKRWQGQATRGTRLEKRAQQRRTHKTTRRARPEE